MVSPSSLNGLAYGAPIIFIDEGALHIPSVYRLGRGGHTTPITAYMAQGKGVPLHWTSACGMLGTVVFNCGLFDHIPVCDACQNVSIEVS